MRIFLSGAAGFIGFHLACRLLAEGHAVLGYDSVNDYYDPILKWKRISILNGFSNFEFCKGLLEDRVALTHAFQSFSPSHVVHLAAQAGVRHSVENPHAYISSNIVGFQNLIELVRERRPENFIYASSSSVYGGSEKLPFSEDQDVRNPVSLYAATKLSNELVATAYGNLYDLVSTGLRFFTVYGPFGRPDMAMFIFAEKMLRGEPIPVFNGGDMRRDFTFIDDIVDGIMRALAVPQIGKIYNLGRSKSEQLLDMIEILARSLDVEPRIQFLPHQLGDVKSTFADTSKAFNELGYNPKVTLQFGVQRFASWYRAYHQEVNSEGPGFNNSLT